MSAILFAQLSAALLAMVAAIFGASIARVLWAEDLAQAQRIDAIRSETEGHLREQIKSLQDTLAIYEKK